MSHLDVIIITVSFFLTSTVGVYSAIRYINQHANPPTSVLSRRGDIELQHFEPSTNNNLDLVQPQQVYISEVIPERVPCISEATYNTSEGISSCSSNYTSEGITTSWSSNASSHTLLQPEQVYIPGIIPSSSMTSYSEDTMNIQRIPSYWNDLNIHCCLEDSINLNYIILFILFFMVVLTIIINNKKIFLTFIYFKYMII